MADYVDATYEDTTLVNVACIVGVIQGKYPANKLGAESIDELTKMGCLTDDKETNITNFMTFCVDQMGVEQTMGAMADLLLNDIFVFNKRAFNNHIQINEMPGDKLQ